MYIVTGIVQSRDKKGLINYLKEHSNSWEEVVNAFCSDLNNKEDLKFFLECFPGFGERVFVNIFGIFAKSSSQTKKELIEWMLDNNYLSNEKFRTEDEMKAFFKLINYDLKKQYDYEFHGFYDVDIFCIEGLYVLEFENIDDYGRSDFNITMLLNTVLLYEFEDEDIYKGEKIYYQDKFYIEPFDIIDDIHLFEYGNIIYGKQVDDILNNGILVSV